MKKDEEKAYLTRTAKRTQALLGIYSAIEPALSAFATANNLSLANVDSAIPRVMTETGYSGTIHREIVVALSYDTSNPGFRVNGSVWYDELMEGGSSELKPRSRHAKLIPFGEWAFDAGSLEGLVELLRQAKDSVFHDWTEEEIAGR